MSDFGIYEHVVTRESGKGSLAVRILLILLAALGLIGLLWLGLITELFFLFFGIAIAAAFAVFLLLRRYSSLEFEYSVAEGTVTFAEIYGKRMRKVTKEFDLRICAVIAPMGHDKLNDFGAEDIYYAVSAPDAKGIYGAAYESEKGKKTVVYFEATEQMLNLCRKSNPRATVFNMFS
jgi:hypothetical protein